MTSLNAYIVTFNCARELINSEFFGAHLFDGLKSRDVPPDLIVLCLQEVAPIAYSFISARMMAQYTNLFETAVKSALRSDFGQEAAEDFQLSQMRNVGMTAIMVFARRDLLHAVHRIDVAGTGVGLWEMGNKGAVGIRLWFEQGDMQAAPLTFVAAHLAPMEEAWERRNTDWQSICERLIFEPVVQHKASGSSSEPEGQSLLRGDTERKSADAGQDMFSSASSVFFAGDLNYRTSDLKPHPDDHKNWPRPHNQKQFATMLQADQLARERAAGKTLHLLDEADVTFPPTYKYSADARKHAQKLLSETSVSATPWAKHRIPSWCDRILFSKNDSLKIKSYTTLPIQPTSDHRPVALSVVLSLKTTKTPVKPPFTTDESWKVKRASARRLEVVVGALAYLSLTREGQTISLCTAAAIFSAILGYHYFLS